MFIDGGSLQSGIGDLVARGMRNALTMSNTIITSDRRASRPVTISKTRGVISSSMQPVKGVAGCLGLDSSSWSKLYFSEDGLDFFHGDRYPDHSAILMDLMLNGGFQ